MKRIIDRPIRDEKGYASVLVLILMLVGGLIIGPLLGFMSTGLLAGQAFEEEMDGFYAADAGVEDALWCLKFGGLAVPPGGQTVLPTFTLNNQTVDVTIDDIGSQTYKITSTTGSTTVEAYVSIASYIYFEGDQDFDQGTVMPRNTYINGSAVFGQNSIVQGGLYVTGDTTISQIGVTIQGDVYVHGSLVLDQDVAIDGNVFADGDITLAQNVIVTGDVYATGNIVLNQNARI